MQTKYLQPKKLAVFITLLSIPLLGHADDANNLANAPMYIASDEGSPNIMLTLGKEHTIFDAAYNDYIDLNDDGIIDLMFDPSIQYEGNFDYTLCYKYQTGTTGLINVGNNEGDFKYLYKVHGDSTTTTDEAVGYWYPVADSTTIKISDAVDNWPKGVEKEIAVCNRSGETGTWSGNFLNYLSSSKLDVIRRVFYGGARVYNDVAPTTSSKQVRYKNTSNGDFGVTLLKNSHITRDAHAWGKVFSSEQYNYKINISDYGDLDNKSTYFFVFATDESEAFQFSEYDGGRFYITGQKEGFDNFRFAPGFMRYGKVNNAGIPGSKGLNKVATNYIWNWASLQTQIPNKDCAIASSTVKVNCSSGRHEHNMVHDVSTKSLLVATCTEKFHGTNCKKYGKYWQPVGILQQYGEKDDSPMRFGMISGNWIDKLGPSATLRAPIGSFPGEIENNKSENVDPFNNGNKINGDFNFKKENGGIVGIIGTLDRYSVYTYNNKYELFYDDCYTDDVKNFVVKKGQNGRINNEHCRNWGNPVGKLLHAVGKYYDPSTDFKTTAEKDHNLGLGYYALNNETQPYHGTADNARNATKSNKNYCSKPNALLIADEDISMDDADYFSSFNNYAGDLDSIKLSSNQYFVGNSKNDNSGYENIPSLKTVNQLSDIAGLAPSAPYSYGTYITAGIAKNLASHKYIKAFKAKQPELNKEYSMSTYVIAMQPAMPEIKINVGGKFVTILPFAKTVSDHGKDGNNYNAKLSTGAIVDFYTQYISDTEGKFRINFEDKQYGSDYDMDWVVSYHYKIHNIGGEKYLQIILENEDGDVFAPQHAGYVITGTANDGVYVDLGKSTFAASETENSLYDYDTIISDAYVSQLSSNFLSNLKNNGNSMKADNKDFNKTSSFYNGNIKQHYDKLTSVACKVDGIEPAKPIYYMNRLELNKCVDNGNGNFNKWQNGKDRYWRVIGDKHRYVDEGIKSSSRIFKIQASTLDPFIKSPLWYAAKHGLSNEASAKAKNNGADTDKDPSNYFKVTNPARLREGLITILDEISSSTHSNSRYATQGYNLKPDVDPAYTAYYNPATWEGDVVRQKVGNDGKLYIGGDTWSAKQQFQNTDVNDRVIFTYDYKDKKTVRFHSSGVDNVNELTYGVGVVNRILGTSYNKLDALSENEVKFITRFTRWMAGDHSSEGTAATEDKKLQLNDNLPLRKRKDDYVLGDIINSTPLVFDDLTSDVLGRPKKVIAVGANDGMLHFINASNGNPIASYLPSQALPHIKDLAKQDYVAQHKLFVNSNPGIYREVDGSNKVQKIVIYGTFGLGLEGAYAIDASKISDINVNNLNHENKNLIIWELSKDSNIANGRDYIGKVKETPTVIMAKDNDDLKKRPFLIINSGYHANKPGLLIVDLLNTYAGEKYPKIINIISDEEMFSGEDSRGYKYNGGTAGAVISTPTVTDLTGSDYYEAIYFGDSHGKVWKIDLQVGTVRDNIACWGYNGNTYTDPNYPNDEFETDCTFLNADKSKPKAIFQAVDANGKSQPITTKIAVGYHYDGVGLAFGTGSYDLSVDGSILSATYNKTQSVYVIRDLSNEMGVDASNNNITRSKLLRLARKSVNDDDEVLYAPTQGQTGDIKYGFYYDLREGKGERVYINPLFVNNYLFVAVNAPALSAECDGGGTSQLYIFKKWRDPSQEEVEIKSFKWLINGMDYVSIGGKSYLMISGDGASGDEEGHKEEPIQIIIPLIINSSWLRLF